MSLHCLEHEKKKKKKKNFGKLYFIHVMLCPRVEDTRTQFNLFFLNKNNNYNNKIKRQKLNMHRQKQLIFFFITNTFLVFRIFFIPKFV